MGCCGTKPILEEWVVLNGLERFYETKCPDWVRFCELSIRENSTGFAAQELGHFCICHRLPPMVTFRDFDLSFQRTEPYLFGADRDELNGGLAISRNDDLFAAFCRLD